MSPHPSFSACPSIAETGAGLDGIESAGEIKKHNPHSGTAPFQVRE